MYAGKYLDTFIIVFSVFFTRRLLVTNTAANSAPAHGPLLKSAFSPEGDGLCRLHKQKFLCPEKSLSHLTAGNSDLDWVERKEKPIHKVRAMR